MPFCLSCHAYWERAFLWKAFGLEMVQGINGELIHNWNLQEWTSNEYKLVSDLKNQLEFHTDNVNDKAKTETKIWKILFIAHWKIMLKIFLNTTMKLHIIW